MYPYEIRIFKYYGPRKKGRIVERKRRADLKANKGPFLISRY
jgi:hypothetical protein